jgi:hypothetical protein
MPNAYGPQMFNQYRSYWSTFDRPTPDYQLFKRYTDQIEDFLYEDGGHSEPQPIGAALEQFRLGARSSRDGGNIENNMAFARGDPAPAALPAAVPVDIVTPPLPPVDPAVQMFKDLNLDAPPDFNCPIARDIMVQPVILINSGITYNSASIETWGAMGNNTDPLTNVILQSMSTAPNLIMNSMIIGHCTIEVTKFYAAVKIQAVIRGKLWVYCMLWVLADAPAAVLAAAEVPAAVPAPASHIMQYEALDIWVQTTFGEDYDWEFLCMMSPANQQSAYVLLPTFRVLEDDGSTLNVGIAIVEQEFETESEEEEESEKDRIKAAEGLLDFAEVLNGDGTVIEISGQFGMYYMTYGGGPEGGYFVVRSFVVRSYKIIRSNGDEFELNNRVGRVELVDDPDMPAGSGAKAVKVWPAAVPAEVPAAADQAGYEVHVEVFDDMDETDDAWTAEHVRQFGQDLNAAQSYFAELFTTCEEHRDWKAIILTLYGDDGDGNVIVEVHQDLRAPLCWNCDKQLTIRVHTYCIKCISTGEEHIVCDECWHDVFEDDDDWVDENASSDEDSDAE